MNQALQDAAQRQLTELQKRAGERRKEGEEERLRLREKVSAKEREMVAIRCGRSRIGAHRRFEEADGALSTAVTERYYDRTREN